MWKGPHINQRSTGQQARDCVSNQFVVREVQCGEVVALRDDKKKGLDAGRVYFGGTRAATSKTNYVPQNHFSSTSPCVAWSTKM